MYCSKNRSRAIIRLGVTTVMALAAILNHGTSQETLAAEPEPEFVMETVPWYRDSGDFSIVGAIVDSGLYMQKGEPITDGNGVRWIRYRFYHRGTGEFSNYFETTLPLEPERKAEYVVVLTAGPGGYTDGQNIYIDDWAVALVTSELVNVRIYGGGWTRAGRKNYQAHLAAFTLLGFFPQ